MASNLRKFDQDDWDRIRKGFVADFAEDAEKFKQRIGLQQVALYVMVGGGMIGRSYVEQPQGAYVDARVGKRPYSMKEIAQAQRLLIIMAEVAGFDPQGFGSEGKPNLPSMPNFHGAGVF
jgi:hypothetical protein